MSNQQDRGSVEQGSVVSVYLEPDDELTKKYEACLQRTFPNWERPALLAACERLGNMMIMSTTLTPEMERFRSSLPDDFHQGVRAIREERLNRRKEVLDVKDEMKKHDKAGKNEWKKVKQERKTDRKFDKISQKMEEREDWKEAKQAKEERKLAMLDLQMREEKATIDLLPPHEREAARRTLERKKELIQRKIRGDFEKREAKVEKDLDDWRRKGAKEEAKMEQYLLKKDRKTAKAHTKYELKQVNRAFNYETDPRRKLDSLRDLLNNRSSSISRYAPCLQMEGGCANDDDTECKILKEAAEHQLKSELCWYRYLTLTQECAAQTNKAGRCMERFRMLGDECSRSAALGIDALRQLPDNLDDN